MMNTWGTVHINTYAYAEYKYVKSDVSNTIILGVTDINGIKRTNMAVK